MTFKTLMVLKALVCLLFGIGFLFFPRALLSLFGVDLGMGGTFPAREYGAALFGNLMLTWFARNAAVPAETNKCPALRAIILALFVYDAIGVVVTLAAMAAGIVNPLGWLAVVIYLFFAVGFGYYLVKKPEAKA